MAHANHLVFYRFKHFPLHSDTTMLCISVTGEDIAPLEGNQQLWAKLLANAVKKHGQGKTLGVLRIDDQTYVPEPREGVPSAEWNTFKQFSNDRPAEDHENWPVDSTTTTQ